MKKVLIILLCLTTKLGLAKQAPPKNHLDKHAKTAIKNDGKQFANSETSRWSVGLNSGATYTMFDVPMDVPGFIWGANVKYTLGHVFSLRTQFLNGTYSGVNNSGTKRNVGFTNNLTQINFHLLANLGSVNFRQKNPNVIYYLFSGISLNFNDGVADHKDIFVSGRVNNYNKTDFSIPLGFGGKYKLNSQFDIGLEGVINAAKSNLYDLYAPYKTQGYADFFGSIMLSLNYNFTNDKAKEHMDWTNPVTVMYDDLAAQASTAGEAIKKDSDADGIPDYLDKEANTKAGYKVDIKGVTLDSDGDGIPDTDDTDPYGFNQMLSVYYPAESFQVKSSVNVMKFSDSIPQDEFITLTTEGYGLPVITFEPNKYDIHVEQYPLLQQIARIMTIDTTVSVAIIGHADNNKPDFTQLTIAQKRALAVKRQLMKIYEINTDRIIIFSEQDAFVKKYKMQTEGLDRKAEFRLIRRQ